MEFLNANGTTNGAIDPPALKIVALIKLVFRKLFLGDSWGLR